MPSDADVELWCRYGQDSNAVNKDAIVRRYLPLVKYVVARMTVVPPVGLDFEDILSFGVIGLLNAIDRFEPERGFSFQTYAVPRIRGSILDELRKYDWLSRTGREKVQKIERATEKLIVSGRALSDENLKKELNVDDKTYRDMLELTSRNYVSSLDEVLVLEEGEVSRGSSLIDEGESPHKHVESKEEIAWVIKLLDKLSERERLVISLYYLEEMTLKEVGLVLNVSESRVSQIHGKAMSTLRSFIVKEN